MTEYHRHDSGDVVQGAADRCIDPGAGAHDVFVLTAADLADAKAAALRSQRDFFYAVDMDAAADHCEEAAIAYEADKR